MTEVLAVIRWKLSSKTHIKVYLALTLVEAFVKNCGERVYIGVNEEIFMNDFAKVVRKYNKSTYDGGEAREVAELSADVMQAWGEAFAAQSQRFPNISRTYFALRREGIQFKAQPDRSRMPTFSVAQSRFSPNYAGRELTATLEASRGRKNSGISSVYSGDSGNQLPRVRIHHTYSLTYALLVMLCYPSRFSSPNACSETQSV